MRKSRLPVSVAVASVLLAGCSDNTPTAAPDVARPLYDNGMMAGSGNRTDPNGQGSTPCQTCTTVSDSTSAVGNAATQELEPGS
jgi:hypothetical protein